MNLMFWKKRKSITERLEFDRSAITGKKWVELYKELRDLNIDFLFIEPDGERKVNVTKLMEELLINNRLVRIMQILLPSLSKKEIENLGLLDYSYTLDFFFLNTHNILRECFVLKRTFFAEQKKNDEALSENIPE